MKIPDDTVCINCGKTAAEHHLQDETYFCYLGKGDAFDYDKDQIESEGA